MELLCKFAKLQSAIKIFNGSSLLLGRIADSNDPVEIKKLRPEYNSDRNLLDEDRISAELNNYLNKILKITCFTFGDYELADELLKADFSEERPPFFSPRMWALYGGNNCDNSGVCIVFNKQKLESQFQQLDEDYVNKFGMIKYENFLKEEIAGSFNINTEVEVLPTIDETVQKYLNNNYEFNYMQKDEDWKEEKEYRLLCWNKQENTNYGTTLLNFDNEDVEAVILGYNIAKNEETEYKPFIQKLFRKNIPVYKIGLLENIPTLKKIYDANDDELKTPIIELNHEDLNEERNRLNEIEE